MWPETRERKAREKKEERQGGGLKGRNAEGERETGVEAVRYSKEWEQEPMTNHMKPLDTESKMTVREVPMRLL